ncbi:putative xyloglucan endotransglucosylase/hydrolase protein 8 [Sarracenia purpurea var. burkii]
MAVLLCVAVLVLAASSSLPASQAAQSQSSSFQDNFSIMWSEDHFKTSDDGQIWFFADSVPIRVFKNADYANNFFPNEKPMYLFSSIWNADNWATRGGLEKTDWKNAPFVSSYTDFGVDACQWEDPYPTCVSTTTANWWDKYSAWHLSDEQKMDFAWVERNLVIYDYCKDTQRYPTLPQECSLSPWD